MPIKNYPFVCDIDPYSGSGPHKYAAYFLELGVRITFIVNCVREDETLIEDSIRAQSFKEEDLINKVGFFRRLGGTRDDTYDPAPIIKAAFDLAKAIALEKRFQ